MKACQGKTEELSQATGESKTMCGGRYPRLEPHTEKDINEITGEIQIKSGVWRIIIYQCWFLSFEECITVM